MELLFHREHPSIYIYREIHLAELVGQIMYAPKTKRCFLSCSQAGMCFLRTQIADLGRAGSGGRHRDAASAVSCFVWAVSCHYVFLW